jgi:Ricin-type beta-trefoil lectin domain/Putative Ig domain
MQIRPIATAAAACLAAMALSSGAAAAANANGPAAPALGFRHACSGPASPGRAECLALVRTNLAFSYLGAAADLTPSGYGPADLQSAYNLALASAAAGNGKTVALVDAYDDPNAASDLAVYRAQYHLPPCTVANGCFAKVNQKGTTSPLPTAAGVTGWDLEESLDIDMVSAICPNCHILLVEANDNGTGNLAAAAKTAASLGAGFVSNSYGAPEFAGETAYDADYQHPGVAVTASAGDSGYGAEYPAASRYVTSVGGTSLTRSSAARGWHEAVWNDGAGDATGSGCSAYEAKPSWQADAGCAARTVADVSADADPNTGVATYDTYQGAGGWQVFGGTSVASPVIASVFALAGPPAAGTYPSSFLYGHTSNLYDVTSGSDGSCSPAYLCTAGVGYDGPTGLGTPDGTAAFMSQDTTVAVTSPGLRHATKGIKITPLAITAADSQPAQALRFTAAGLPPGLSISPSGVITGTPTARGYYPVTVRATDARGITGSAAFKWTVDSVGAVKSGLPGRCLDDWHSGTANGTKADIFTCNGSTAQAWSVSLNANGTLQIRLVKSSAAGACLTVKGGGTASGTLAELFACNTAGQEWTAGASGHLVNPQSGRCLIDPAAGPNGTQLRIGACTNTADERWTLP